MAPLFRMLFLGTTTSTMPYNAKAFDVALKKYNIMHEFSYLVKNLKDSPSQFYPSSRARS